MTRFVDADHAGCHETRRSHTDIIIFGSEIVALKIAVETVEGLRFKLRMMGVPLYGPATLFCDNESVVKNTTHSESMLKKKQNGISYHKICETLAAGVIQIAKDDGKTNIADLLTNLMPGPRLRELVAKVLRRLTKGHDPWHAKYRDRPFTTTAIAAASA